MVTGTNVTYVGGTRGIELPPRDDTAIRAPHKPWCTSCKRKVDLNADHLCERCVKAAATRAAAEAAQPPTPARGRRKAKPSHYPELPEDELLRRFTGPDDTRLGRDLADLEATDPKVAAAAASLEDAVDRMIRPDDHDVPQHLDPENVTRLPLQYSPDANLDAQVDHAERVLRATAASDDHVVRLLRLNALSAIEALHLYVELHVPPTHQTPAPATSTPTGAGHTSPEPPSASQGLGGGQPAARTEGEAVARPATTRRRRVMDTDEARRQRRRGPSGPRVDVDRIVELYTTGKTIQQVHEETGYATATIRRHLIDRGVTMRPRGGVPGRSKGYPQDLIDQVRTLYVDEQLTQAAVAERIGTSTKVVQNVMTYAGIESRDPANVRSMAGIGHPIKIQPDQHQVIIDRYRAGEPASAIARDYDCAAASIYHVLEQHGVERQYNRTAPGVDTLGRVRDAIAATGATSRQIKEWAKDAGLVYEIRVGLPSLGLVEAYAAAHPTATPTPTGDPIQ